MSNNPSAQRADSSASAPSGSGGFWLRMMSTAVFILAATFISGSQATVELFGHEVRWTSLGIYLAIALFVFGTVFGSLAVIWARMGASKRQQEEAANPRSVS